MTTDAEKKTIEDFYQIYMDRGTLIHNTAWLENVCLKIPFDMWTYQEIMWQHRPDIIVECGTFGGGSALFLAGVYDQIARYTNLNGKIITIDLWEGSKSALTKYPHPRVQFIQGSTVDPLVFQSVKEQVQGKKVMVALDSDHSADHVFQELELYHTLIEPNQYLVVEDTCTEGPRIGLERWLPNHPEFIVDKARHEKFHLSQNPGGYLKRI